MSKVIVITGASAGIGAVLARQLAARGDHLMLAARRAKELSQLARSCGRDTFPFTTDVTRRQDVNRLRDEALRTFDHVDVWINNAGRGITRNVLDLTDEDIDEMMTVNVKSALYGMQAILPHFKERGQGHLMNVSSMLGRIPLVASRSAYNASKSALNALTANLRMDLRVEYPGIQVSLVMPGAVQTEFAANALHAPAGSGPAPMAQTVEEVVAAMIDLIDHPRAEIYTNPDIQVEQVRRYYDDVAAFEANLG
ncbi:MAG: SDR family NAD(P)-dependent oxidoreductase [Chloroflexi bacterium]|nr:SDR family NAD(P)-dependent oxidoreductase [Chloroflexota bacterium]